MVARVTQLRSEHPIAVRRRRRVVTQPTMSEPNVLASPLLEVATEGAQVECSCCLSLSANIRSNYADHFLASTTQTGFWGLLESLALLIVTAARFILMFLDRQRYPWVRTYELGLGIVLVFGDCAKALRGTREQRRTKMLYMAGGGLLRMMLGCALKTKHNDLLFHSLPDGLILGYHVADMLERGSIFA